MPLMAQKHMALDRCSTVNILDLTSNVMDGGVELNHALALTADFDVQATRTP
jgi:hypothetical protein